MSSEIEIERPSTLMRLRAVLKLIPVSKSAWWAGIKAGRFPRPIELGPRLRAWKVSDIDTLIKSLTK